MDDVDGSNGGKAAPDFNNGARTGDGYIRTVDNQSTTNFGITTFVDFAVSCAYLDYVKLNTSPVIDLTCGQNLYFQLASINNANDHNNLTGDIGGGQSPSDPPPSQLSGPVATYATVGDFNAFAHGNQVVVEWETLAEMGTLGFELERRALAGEFERVAAGLIPARGEFSQGGTYRVVDAAAVPGQTYTYRLTEVEASGNRREIGQYDVTPGAGPAARAQTFPNDDSFVPRAQTAVEKARLDARRAERMQKTLTADNNAGKGGDKAAIGVQEPGLYYVSAAQLAQTLNWAQGKVIGLIRGRQLRLSSQGQDIAWLPDPKAQGLYFYGSASASIYDAQNVYVLEQGHGTLMDEVKVQANGPADVASRFAATVSAEENLFAGTVLAKNAEEDYWFWISFNAAGSPCDANQFSKCSRRDVVITAPEALSTGSARLVVKLRGASALPPDPDHRLAVSLNGTPIGQGQWDGLTDYDLILAVDPALLRPDGANTVRIEALSGAASVNSFYLQRLELTYPRRYQAAADQLLAAGDPQALLVASGFSSSSVSIFDLTDPIRPKTVSGAKIEGAAGSYQVRFAPTRSDASYLMLAPTAVRTPASLRAMQAVGITGRGAAQYVLIAPEAFRADAERLVAFRASQGLSAQFVSLEAIYDDYGAGQKTPHALRAFLADATRTGRQPPGYVVLGGKGTFDPKDYLGYGTNRLPVLMALTGAGLIAADQRFVDSDGDGIGEIPIGRLPAVTAAEFKAMVDKTIGYEAAGSGSGPVILLADGPDDGGNYTADSETLAHPIEQAGHTVERIYLEQMSATEARAKLLASLQTGADLFNYFGHAGVLALAHNLLTTSDAAALTNKAHLPVMTGMTCFMSRFELPNYTTLGESLLINPAGGAAAVWSPGGYSYNDQASEISAGFFKALLTDGESRLGDAAVKALSAYVHSGGAPDVPGIYNFLGDPASSNPTH